MRYWPLCLAVIMRLCVVRAFRAGLGGRATRSVSLTTTTRLYSGVSSDANDAGEVHGESSPSPKKKIRISTIKRTSSSGSSGGSRSSSSSITPSKFVTVQLGTDKDVQDAEMDERLKDAQRWVSKRLSDDEANILNRAMGIEEDVFAALEEEERMLEEGKGGGGGGKGKKGKEAPAPAGSKIRKLRELSTDETRAAARVKGFLEMNPYICSGCGAPFQSKSGDSPGFLPKEKLQEHRSRAGMIREKQEAIRILELAGIEVDSPAAEELLREADVPLEVIAGVRALGKGQNVKDNVDFLMRKSRGMREAMQMAGTAQGEGEEENFFEEEEEQEEEEDVRDEAKPSIPRIAALKKTLAGVTRKKKDDEEEEDVLDGLEINLDDFMAQFDNNQGPNKDKSVSSALIDSFSKAAEAAASSSSARISKMDAVEMTASKGIRAGTIGVINDIDNELRSADHQRTGDNARGVLRGGKRFQNLMNKDNNNDDEEDLYAKISKRAAASENESAEAPFAEPICICQRCFRLQQYGQVEQNLRPGWSDHELLTPERFEQLLGVVKEGESVVLCIVDIFDLRGSLLANLKQIAGNNPIVIAANKADLLPRDASDSRLIGWVHSEVKNHCGLRSPKQVEEEQRQEMITKGWHRPNKGDEDAGILRRQNVHLVSCTTGMGMEKLMESIVAMAQDHGNKIYVMGAANVGKSSFINRLLETSSGKKTLGGAKKKRDNVPTATVSNLPGTTLDFLKIRLPNGITMIDTPGLLNTGQLTAKLTTDELRQVIPSKPINAVTLRVSEGKCVLIGGLASIELTQGRPFYFTFFVSNEVKLHPTDSTKAQAFLDKHVGGLVTPPASPERLAELGPPESFVFQVEGESWKTASTDIVIAGLGWVSITGPGACTVKVTAPAGTSVGKRSALLPFEASHSTAKFTGGRIEKKSKKPGNEKSYGWRA